VELRANFAAEAIRKAVGNGQMRGGRAGGRAERRHRGDVVATRRSKYFGGTTVLIRPASACTSFAAADETDLDGSEPWASSRGYDRTNESHAADGRDLSLSSP